MNANQAPGIYSARPRLVDLISEGSRLLQDLRGPTPPTRHETLRTRALDLIELFRRESLSAGYAPDMVTDAVYAISAAIDEAVLTSAAPFRDAWQVKSLQLSAFGDQLAGEHFFERLDTIRMRGPSHTEVAEIYHLCLALGFKGRFALADSDQLQYLTSTLGDDVSHGRLKGGPLAPAGARPDDHRFILRRIAPAWAVGAVLCVALAVSTFALRTAANSHVPHLAERAAMIRVPAQVAHLKITLP